MSRLIKKSGKNEKKNRSFKNNGYRDTQNWMMKCSKKYKN